MSKLTKVMVVAVLALWSLATVHCDLEQLPGCEFLAWCHSQDAGPQPNNNCTSDDCSAVESALYKAEQPGVVVPMPVLALSFLLPVWDITSVTSARQPAVLNLSPPELPRLWQFALRAALPPRAPSLAA